MEAPSPPWIELPTDLTVNILSRLETVEILESVQKVCTTWWKVCKHQPAVWRVITMVNTRRAWMQSKLPSMCRRAVDLSRGELIELNLDGIGNCKLLNYVADRPSNLKRLQLNDCIDINKGLAEVVKKLPQLEELHLTRMKNVPPESIVAIGNSCPKLKSFTYNFDGTPIFLPEFIDDESSGYQYSCNNYAQAIANSMPNLQHLRLCGDLLNKKGLEAILDACPRLESLDVRQCYWLDLSGDLGRRCSEQMKVLKRPSDSVRDVPWLTDPDRSYDYGCPVIEFVHPECTHDLAHIPDDSFECYDSCCFDYNDFDSDIYFWHLDADDFGDGY